MKQNFKFKKLSTVTTTVICLICCTPQQGICAAIPIEQVAMNLANFKRDLFPPALCIGCPSPPSLERSFGDLTEVICDSTDPLKTTRQFFLAFIDQLNQMNGTSLTVEEACRIIRQNIDLMPAEHRESLFLGIQSIESNELPKSTTYNALLNTPTAKFYWPWEWNWFGLNKKDKIANDAPIAAITVSDAIIIFAIIAAAITLVAIFNAPAIPAAATALTQAATLILNKSA